MATSPYHSRPIVNVFRLSNRIGSHLHYRGSMNGHPGHPFVVQIRQTNSVLDAIAFAGEPLFGRGEWFLDSRYRLLPEIDLSSLERASENNICVYQVGHLPDDPVEQERTTYENEEDRTFGGLYYVGGEALKMMATYKNRSLLFNSLLRKIKVVATTRRYSTPIRVLYSRWDNFGAAERLVKKLEELYAPWAPEVKVVRSPGSIREGHKAVFDTVPVNQPVLVVDADFEPNGNLALLHRLQDGEDQYVHLWHTQNRVNDAVYGHGSPKLINPAFFDLNVEGEDMTMSCTVAGLKIHPEIVGNHGFDYSESSTFRTTVREVAKLARAAKTDEESRHRLGLWLSSEKSHRFKNAYRKGLEEGLRVADNNSAIFINDFSTFPIEKS